MFKRLINSCKRGYKAVLTGLTAALAPGFAFAQIDVTAATGAITDGQTATITILIALITAYGAFLGYRMVKAAVRRG